MYAGGLGQIHDFDDLTMPHILVRLQYESDDTLSSDNVFQILPQGHLIDLPALEVRLARSVENEGHLVLDLIEDPPKYEPPFDLIAPGWATIAHSTVFMPVRPEVQGYKVHPLGGHIFTEVGLAE